MKYLVTAYGGPSFDSVDSARDLLQNIVHPTFDKLIELESAGKVTGGLPVGELALAFIVSADSTAELDALLQSLPIWGTIEWDVTALASFADRKAQEVAMLGS